MNVTKHIICELTGYRPGAVDVSQGDRGSRAVSCRLLENGAPWIIPEGATVRVAYTLPDGTDGLYDALPDGSPAGEIVGNIVTVELADQLMAQKGMAQVSILVIGPAGGQIATWPIRVMVGANRAARLTVPENMPPYGAGFAGKIFFGGADGTVTPLGIGEGVEIVRQENGSYVLAAYGGAGGGGIQEEKDPTVPDWAKQPQKPSYTAQEVGALPAGTKIPAKTSDLSNDSGFINKSVADLVNYYTKTQTEDLIAQIPKFRISVVQQLPTAGEELVLYLVPFATAEGQYLEYIWVGGRFEVIGSQRVDLTGYATESWVQAGYQPKGNYLTQAPVTSVNGKTGAVSLKAADVGAMSPSEVSGIITNALDEAKKNGEFNGTDGRGITSITRTSGNGAAGTVDTYTIAYTDGTTSTFQVRNGANGKDGKDGNGIKSVVLNADYTLTLNFDDGTAYTTDSIRGATGNDGKDGNPGADGQDGSDGVGIASIEQTTTSTADGGNNVFTITLTNGNRATFAVKNGSKGSTGSNGKDGKTPVKGTDYYTDADKTEMVNAVLAALPRWEGGSY